MVLNVSTEVFQRTATRVGRSTEISKVISAAVINKSFREMLLDHPGLALNQGFGGQNFYLTDDEKAVICSIKATNLSDFSRALTSYLN